MQANRLYVVVHGIGLQPRFGPLRLFVEAASGVLLPQSIRITRARLASKRFNSDPVVKIDQLGFYVAEFNYAATIEKMREMAESDTEQWLKTVPSQIASIDEGRGTTRINTSPVEGLINDVLTAGQLVKFAAHRIKGLDIKPIGVTAAQLLQQIQLYADFDEYRDQIDMQFHELIQAASKAMPTPPDSIVILAHSLGTIVSFRALLHAAGSHAAWINQVERFVTFGSPLDLFLTLYPEIFKSVTVRTTRPISWDNYFYENDPVATDLQVVRAWLSDHAPGLFAKQAPREITLGHGSNATAHSEYWTSTPMHADIFRDRTLCRPISSIHSNKTSSRSPLLLASYLLATAASLFFLIWWQENVWIGKDSPTPWERELRIGGLIYRWMKSEGGFEQGISSNYWLFAVSHLLCYPAAASLMVCQANAVGIGAVSLKRATNWIAGAVMANIFLCFFLLPPMKSFLESGGADLEYHLYGTGNFAVFFILLLFLIVGVKARRRISRTVQIASIGICMSFGALGLGNRTDPANFLEELETLGAMAGLWWLATICARLDFVWNEFVGGREHIDYFCRHWSVRLEPRQKLEPLQDPKEKASTVNNDSSSIPTD